MREVKSLPPTIVADVTGRDSDGELLASPAEWLEEVVPASNQALP